jgi:hypothetical protein
MSRFCTRPHATGTQWTRSHTVGMAKMAFTRNAEQNSACVERLPLDNEDRSAQRLSMNSSRWIVLERTLSQVQNTPKQWLRKPSSVLKLVHLDRGNMLRWIVAVLALSMGCRTPPICSRRGRDSVDSLSSSPGLRWRSIWAAAGVDISSMSELYANWRRFVGGSVTSPLFPLPSVMAAWYEREISVFSVSSWASRCLISSRGNVYTHDALTLMQEPHSGRQPSHYKVLLSNQASIEFGALKMRPWTFAVVILEYGDRVSS